MSRVTRWLWSTDPFDDFIDKNSDTEAEETFIDEDDDELSGSLSAFEDLNGEDDEESETVIDEEEEEEGNEKDVTVNDQDNQDQCQGCNDVDERSDESSDMEEGKIRQFEDWIHLGIYLMIWLFSAELLFIVSSIFN